MKDFSWARSILGPFRELAHKLLDRLPGFAAAFLLLFLGLLTARALRSFIERTLQRASLDDYTGSVGINELFARMGFGKSPTYAAGFIAYWSILLTFVVTAANAVDLPAVSQLLERFLRFLPSLVAAILILFGGLMFARFLSEIVANAADVNDVRGGAFLSRAAYAIILVFASLMALEQLGLQMSLITSSIQILLASLGLAFAVAFGLAFGLGGKGMAEELLRDLLDRAKSRKG